MVAYFTSSRFIETLIVVIFGVCFIWGSGALDKKYLKTKSGNGKWYHSAKMIIDFINTVIIALLVLTVLSINGVDVGKYVKSLGVLGVILTFALQDMLKDVIMGLSIMFEGYFKVGDVVEFDGQIGKVISFNIKTTRLFMIDTETTMSVSNRNISQIGIASDWLDIIVPIGYDVDLHYSRTLCRECARRIERLRYVYSCDFLNTQELAESWIEYKLRVHCLPEKKPAIRRNSNAVVQDVFYEHNQEFPLSIKVLYNVDPNENKDSKPDKIEAAASGSADVQVIDTTEKKRKSDYELGAGAIRSKSCVIDSQDRTINNAIKEVDRYCGAENLSKEMRLRVRLLSEELLSLVQGIPSMEEGSFYIERDGSDYDLCFDANAKINKETKELLMGVSTSNTGGFGLMVSQAIESMMQMSINDKKGVQLSSMDTMEESIGKDEDNYKWSYNIYKEKEEQLDIPEIDIDEESIGKSVLTSLADDIRITFKRNKISMKVLVKSIDEE